jgi:hypothetical protein
MTSLSKIRPDNESESAFVNRAMDSIARTMENTNGVSAQVLVANLTARLEAARTRDHASKYVEVCPIVPPTSIDGQ